MAGFHSRRPTRREFVFFLQLLRGENEPANPPVHRQALLLQGVLGGKQGSSFGSAAVVYGENARKPSAHRALVRSPVIVKSRQRDSRWRRKLRTGRRVFKTVGRRHPALCWVPTRSPLGCDTNKPGGHRSRYPRSSLCPPAAGVSFASAGPVWPGLAWPGFISGGDDSSAWRGAQREKTITLKADRIQMTRIHTRQMFLRLCHSVMLPPSPSTPTPLWVRNDSPRK